MTDFFNIRSVPLRDKRSLSTAGEPISDMANFIVFFSISLH